MADVVIRDGEVTVSIGGLSDSKLFPDKEWTDSLVRPYVLDDNFPLSVTRNGKVRFAISYDGYYKNFPIEFRGVNPTQDNPEGTIVRGPRYHVSRDWWQKVRKIGVKI